MKFAIAGAGAMGCRLGYQLLKSGNDVVFIDTWQEHVHKIKKDGLQVTFNGVEDTVRVPIYFPEDIDFTVDVVIMLPKALQLKQTLAYVVRLFHAHTKVVCLLNGLGYERLLVDYVKPEQLIMGTTIWTAQLTAPGQVYLAGVGSVTLQNYHPSAKNETLEIVALLDHAGLSAQYSDEVYLAIWRKSCVNGFSNALSAVLESNLEQLTQYSRIEDLTYNIVSEFAQAAATQGVTLDPRELTTFCIGAARRVGKHFTSMYQDLIQHNRRTEIDFINGEVVRLGQEYGFATPYNDMIVQLIHMKEEILGAK